MSTDVLATPRKVLKIKRIFSYLWLNTSLSFHIKFFVFYANNRTSCFY